MIHLRRWELPTPRWLWAAVPLAFVLCVAVAAGLRLDFNTDRFNPDSSYLHFVESFAAAALAGFLLIDLARRADAPWYGVVFLYFASWGAAALIVTDGIVRSIQTTGMTLVGLARMMVAGARSGDGGVVLYAAMLAVAVLLAVAVALFVTLMSRFFSRLPLLTSATRWEFWANLIGAGGWLLAAVGGYLWIRFALGEYNARSAVPQWLPFAAATGAGMLALALHLFFADRSRRREAATPGKLRVWPLVGICLLLYLAKPTLYGFVPRVVFGEAGLRAYYAVYFKHVAPAMHSVRLLLTPSG